MMSKQYIKYVVLHLSLDLSYTLLFVLPIDHM